MTKIKKALIVVASIVISLIFLIYIFPVYRLIGLGGLHSFYNRDEVIMALYIGSPWDRLAVRDIMELAREALEDFGHTNEENEEKYGKLYRYARSKGSSTDVERVEADIKLWSAHLGKDKGYMWVCYSQAGYDNRGNVSFGSWGVPSLWTVEKDSNGIWVVVDIKEHA